MLIVVVCVQLLILLGCSWVVVPTIIGLLVVVFEAKITTYLMMMIMSCEKVFTLVAFTVNIE